MELVIDIPEEEYQTYINHTEAILDSSIPLVHQDLLRAVINGTPLPKGHGDLVDRDAINSRFYGIYEELESLSNQPTYKELLDKLSMCLDTAPTIIEIDKE